MKKSICLDRIFSSQKSNPLVGVAVTVASRRNGNEAVAGAASEALGTWLHRAGHIISPRDVLSERK